MKSTTKILVAALFVFVILVPGQVYALNGDIDKPSPSSNYSVFTIFDANFIYLDDGSGYISNLGNGKVKIGGETLGTRTLDTIGVQVTLQKWSGNSWDVVSTGANSTSINSSFISSSRELTVTTGYYYRVVTTHWISYGNTLEEGTRYSNYLLIN